VSRKPDAGTLLATLRLPYVPASLNRVLRWNPHRKKRERDMWARDLYIVAGLKQAKDLRECSVVKMKVRMVITIHNPKRYDRDNAWGAAKIPVDAMRQISFIHNDTEEFLDLDVKQETSPARFTVIEVRSAP
jgi:hypothetical protein